MNNQKKFNQQNSKLILEELEERRLFSGGIEGLIVTGLDSDEHALYADADANKTQIDSTSEKTSASAAEQQSQEIVFVDAGVDNHQQLVDDLLANSDSSRNIEVVVLDRDRDGIQQISAALQDRDDLDAIHIISHGSDGSIELGNTSLNSETLQDNNLSIALWANSFAETGDILVYGCNLAVSEVGQSLIADLGALTLTDVAASDDATGHESLGGDWDLEYQAGEIEAGVVPSAELQARYQHILAVINGTAGDDVLVGTAASDVISAGAGNDVLVSGGGSDQMLGEADDDIFRFTGALDGDVYTVDGGTGTDTIDLSGYASTAATFGDGTMTIDMGGGQSFSIDYTLVNQIAFSDITATVLTGSTSASGWSGTGLWIDGDEAFKVNMSGAGTIDIAYDTGSDTFSVTGSSGVDATSSLAITDLNGTDLSIDQIVLDEDFGDLTTNTGVGTISIAGQYNDINGTFTIGGDLGSIYMYELKGTLDVQGDAGTIHIGRDILVGGTLTVSGDVTTLQIDDDIAGTVNITGNVTTFDLTGTEQGSGDILTGSSVTIGGNIGTWNVHRDINSAVTVDGSVGSMTIGRDVLGDITIGGDLDSASMLTVGASTTITVAQVVGTFVFDVGGTDHGGTYPTPVVYVFDGATQTASTTPANIAPVNSVPGPQSTNEETALVFSTANGNLISISDADAGGGDLAVTLEVNDGTLSLSGTTGLTFVAGSNNSGSMTFSGTLLNINAALDGLTFMPNPDFFGAVNLQVTSHDDTSLVGIYTFDDPVNPGNDGSPGSLNNGVVNGATPVNDATRGDVLSFDGVDDGVQISGLLGQPADVTLSAWINFTKADPGEVISLGGSVLLRAGDWGAADGVRTSYYDGSWQNLDFSTPITGTGWRHVAFVFDDTNDMRRVYLDGVEVASAATPTSITHGVDADTFIGQHPTDPTDFFFEGMIDDARIYGRALTAAEITSTMNGVPTSDSDNVAITVNSVNDAGTFAGDTAASTNEDTATAGTVTFADTADGFTTPNFNLTTAASNGVATIDAAGNWTYTPTGNYNGADSFTVQVTDDDGHVETQVISITVTPIDDAGTFGGNTSATTNEDTATSGTVTFADTADGFTTANFSLNTAASNGVAAIDAAGNWTYTPSANYNGADSFTVQVTDDDGHVETQVISITVNPIDDAGTFGGDISATTNEDTATAGTVTFADAADGFTTPNFTLNTAASNGVAAIDAAGNWTYTPSANYNGSDTFTVQVTDDDGHVETQVISITVTPIDDTGTFGGNTSATTNEDTATAGTVTFADTADGFTTANFSLNTAASNGVAAIDAAGNWTYTPSANYNGADSFTVQVTDDDGHVETQVISITVNPIDDAGTFGGDISATTNEDTATAGTVTFADAADGFTTPNFTLNTAASNGVATIDAAGNWTYTPGANFNGADSFTVQVTDDDGNVETQIISLTVTAIDDSGTFGGNTSATTNEDTATAGTVTFADTADGFTTANFSINTAASNGVAAIDAAGNWTYTPTANYNGSDSFTVQVTDDDGHVETQVISLTVTAIDDTGTFGGNTSATTNEDTATAGTVTFADTADGFTTANFSINTAASNGVAAIDAVGNWTYTPTANYNGSDSFTVQVTDDDGHVETQVISLTVSPINDSGTFGGNTSATTNEDTATAGTVTFSDTTDGFTTANFSINTAASNGVAAIDAAGNWTYTPSANYNGSDSFTVQVTDDDGHVETQVISLTVSPINDSGTFGGNTSATTNEDTATAGTVTFADTADGFTTANFSMNTAASNGVAAIDAAGNWTYTPTTNYNGADSFTVQVTDDDGHVETQVISITVTAIDDAGTFGGNTSATTNEDTATAGTVTFADTADGFTTANFSLTTAATNGVAAIDAAGNWTYTPTTNYNGADSFTVQVTDDDGNVETQVISLTVTPINDAGTFGGDTSAATNEDTATAGTVTFADTADGFTTANFSINIAASNGVAAIDAAGNWTYTPTANFNGSDSFTVQVTDDDGHVENQVISLTVTPINDAGTFGGTTSATTNEDTATAGTVTFADVADGFTTANFSLNTAATNGVAAIDAAGNWTYTPTANYNGSDSFTVQVTDDDGNIETQVVSITVTPIDDAGTFGGNTSATTNEDTATAGTVTFADAVDGFTTPNFTINAAASNGVAAIDAAGNWTYTPGSNYNGADSFTVQVTDDDGHVETQVISLTVTPIDDAGTFGGNTSATTNEDTATAGTVTFADAADGFTTPNFSLNTAASNGVAAIDAAGNWTYTPTANYNGADSFTVQVTDDDGHVETQVISLTVTAIDDAGTFGGNTSATTNEDTATAGTVTFSDTADGFTTPNFSLNTAASNGVAAIDAAGNWTYTPTANYNGSDSFTVQVTDDDGNVETQVISLTVTPIDDTGSFGGNTSATTNEDTVTAGTVTFADTADGFTTANFSINTAASNGVAAIDAAGNWTYTPTANYNGSDSFTVQVTDDDGNIETQVVSITVTPIDDAGTFGGNTSATTNEDTATAGTVTFADAADGFTTPNFTINAAASNGVAAIDAAGNWTYTPGSNYNGADSFTVQVTDDDGHVETQVISLTVTPIDDAGTFGGNTSATTNEDTATAGTVTFADAVDGFTTPNFSINTAASNGVAAIDAAGNWTYTPTANYNGADSFTVQVTDDDGHVETQVISLTVTAIDDAGTFSGNTSATTNEDTATAGTVTFSDTADGFTTPNFSLNTAASNGVAAIDAAGNWTYTPTANYNGSDSFTVQVTDDDGNVETQVISLTVTQIDDTGSFGGNTSATTNEDTATAGTVTFADTADGFTTANFSINTAASNGVAAIDAAGNWTYTPTANYNGSDSFTVQVTDDDGNIETQVVSITVTPIDDAGTFGGNTSATTNEDTATAGTVTFSDTTDGFTTPNFSLNTAASNGVAAIDAAGNWTYTPTGNYNGADSFTVQVTDDDGHVETQVISLTVTAIDDAGTFGGNTSATTNEDTATAGTVTFSDTADGFTTPNFSLNTAASNGVAAIDAAGNWTYTPTANYNGADSFTVQVTDDDGNVETQVISLTVTQIDDTGAFGGNTSATTNEDTATAGTVTFSDTADGFTTPNFSLNTAASNGVAAIDAAGNWTYTPTANYNGSDSFTVQVTDDDGNVETQVISLTVTPIDDTGSFGGNTSATTNEDTATAGTVTFADTADGFTTANFSINTAASNGVAAIDAAGNWTYTPTANYNGSDSFTVQVTDDDGNIETQVVSITVTPIDDAGTFGGNTSATTNEDTATAGTVTFSDTTDGFTTPNFSLNTAASNGVAAIDAAGNWTYTPTGNYNGADSFTVQVTDDDGHVETQVISLTVTAIDDAGTFGGNTSATTNEDTATAGTVTFSDTADGFTTPNFSLNTAASNGVAAIDAAGNWTYTPTGNYNGADSFTVQVTDDDGHVETQVISLTVTAIDDAGTFGGNTSATTNEDTATAGTVTFSDTADGFTTPNFSINTAASNGVAAIDAAGNWTYTPTGNYNGADSFTVQVTDDDGHVETQVISLTVTAIDDAGTFGGNTSATTNEDTATAGTVTFADAIDGFTTPNFSLNTAATNGVAAIDAAGNWTYTPTANYNGADSFTVQVTDDDGHVETQVISLTVTAIDDAGTFGGNTSATTNEDTATAGTVTFSDTADGFTTPNFSINTAASNGVAAIDAAGNWTYTPTANYNGADSFTVQVTDDDGHVETQIVSLTVTAIDDAGTFGGNTSATTNEDMATAGTVTFADAIDGFTTPNFSLNTAASNGVAAIDAAGNWTYTPTANYNGADSFTVQVTDDDGHVETQVVSVTVTPIDDTGTFGGNTSATTNEDTATAGTVTFADTADGFTTPNFSLNTAASNGVAAIDPAGNWTYTPTGNYNGADSFTVEVTDDDGHVETQVISLTITAVDDAGTFGGNTSATTNEDTATAGNVTFADAVDGFTTPNFSLNTAASNGVAAIDAAGNWTYTPGSNYNGADSFTVQVTDDDGHVETQVISLTITAVDDAGTFGGNISATTNEDTATAGTVTFADTADGFTTPNFSLNAAASNGVAVIDAAGNWTYTPTANYNGADSFTVQVTDDDGHVETQVVSITVTPIDDTGTFGGNTSATTNEDTATAGTVTFADAIDGFTTPNFSLNTAATNGVAAIDAAGNWTYTPTANYNGADSFTVQVTDDDGNVEIQVVSITVTPIDDAGTFGGNTSATTNEDTATAGTVTFSDTADGFTTPNFSLNAAASNGVAAIDAAGNWTYTPTANYNGVDSFTVQVTDDDGHVETQVISLTVTPIDDAGTFGGNTSATTNEDTATAGTVTFADTADGFTTPNFTLNAAASNGVAAIDAAGNWTYTPTANYNGVDSFTVQVTDDDGHVETQVISLTVTPIDDAAVIAGVDTGAVTEDVAVSANDISTSGLLTIADPDIGQSSFVAQTINGNFGDLTIDTSGNWNYSADNGNPEIQALQSGDSFTETLTVTSVDGTTHKIVITINGAADARPPPPTPEPPPEYEPPVDEPPEEVEEAQSGTGEDPILKEITSVPQSRSPLAPEADSSFAQADEAKSEPVDYGPAIDKQPAKIPEQPQPQAVQAQNFSIDTLTLQISDDEALNTQYELELLDRIDSMHLGMDDAAAQQNAEDVNVQIFVGSTASFTVGIVSWVLRGGALLASLMSTVPLLNRFDPLPILKAREGEEDVEPSKDEDTQTRGYAKKVDNMFSGKEDSQQ